MTNSESETDVLRAKPREWWIRTEPEFDHITTFEEDAGPNHIHVIEKSAFDSLTQERDALVRENEFLKKENSQLQKKFNGHSDKYKNIPVPEGDPKEYFYHFGDDKMFKTKKELKEYKKNNDSFGMSIVLIEKIHHKQIVYKLKEAGRLLREQLAVAVKQRNRWIRTSELRDNTHYTNTSIESKIEVEIEKCDEALAKIQGGKHE